MTSFYANDIFVYIQTSKGRQRSYVIHHEVLVICGYSVPFRPFKNGVKNLYFYYTSFCCRVCHIPRFVKCRQAHVLNWNSYFLLLLFYSMGNHMLHWRRWWCCGNCKGSENGKRLRGQHFPMLEFHYGCFGPRSHHLRLWHNHQPNRCLYQKQLPWGRY